MKDLMSSGATIESRLSLVGADRSQNPKSPADCGAVVRESEVSVQLSRGDCERCQSGCRSVHWTAATRDVELEALFDLCTSTRPAHSAPSAMKASRALQQFTSR
ncbi:hypothetical protein EVAR_100435_1 [Eumeta japonica]|uniref:Uncharacterized protein n=1 Tax=Eumeta variegata TaxID=151549 RepID=A0A4C1THE9_EUMVA|nr:hypothetical protein EVAR_100435_1 [Eumeta japonica]